MKILLLSDTHSYIDDRILDYAKETDEIWHCGDFGSMEVIEKLQSIKPLRGVWGNIDSHEIRAIFPEVNRFHCENVEVLMIHIGGYILINILLERGQNLKMVFRNYSSRGIHIF